eukprot:UN22903
MAETPVAAKSHSKHRQFPQKNNYTYYYGSYFENQYYSKQKFLVFENKNI